MRSLLLSLLIVFLFAFSGDKPKLDKENCKCGDIYLSGRVRIVRDNADFKVSIDNNNPDFKVVTRRDESHICGEWYFVKANADFTIEFVEYNADFTISFGN